MPRLTAIRFRRRASSHRGDRGAAATLVAILLAGGVLLGMTALVVDVGQLYAEREELQSVADSTAMDIALECAMDREDCDESGVASTAEHYAGNNARDGLADAAICGSDSRLPECTEGDVGNLTDCLNERPDNGAEFVEVRTTTRTSDGTLLPPSFAQTLVSGHQGTTVGACSRVAWGAPAGGLAVTFSACDWDESTDGGESFPPPGASDSVLAGYETVLQMLEPQDEDAEEPECPEGPSGFNTPGGFGWLDDAGECETEILDTEDGQEYGGSTGVAVSGVCKSTLDDAIASRTALPMPIFESAEGPGNNQVYTLKGIGAFVPTGYRLPGGGGNPNVESSLTGSTYCGEPDTCIYGYFTEGLLEWAGPIGGPTSFGAVVVRTVG